jgi:MFS family permease
METVCDPQKAKARGWVAIVAGVFIVALMGGVWIFLLKLIAENRTSFSGAANAQFLGQVFTAFALIIIAGFGGIANGIIMLRTGRRSKILFALLIMCVLAAVVIIWLATNSRKT